MVTGIADPALRAKALERQIDAARSAIARSRATWLIAMLLVFVVTAAMFNATLSWNKGQIERRAQILGAISEGPVRLREDLRTVDFMRSALVQGVGELAYLRMLAPGSDPSDSMNAASSVDAFKRAIEADLLDHVHRGTAFDTINIPFIGVAVTGTDIGIVGGLALAIVGFWLLASLRRENHALGEFIRRLPDSGVFRTDFAGFSPEESTYAYRCIAHEMVFSVSTRESIINKITIASFLAPTALLFANHLSSIVMLFRRQIGDYLQLHTLMELGILICVASIWSAALVFQTRTLSALQAWATTVEDWVARASTGS